MAPEKKKKYKNLSGGMKRRLALAISLVNNPSIIIADEPTTGVDPYERIRMRELLLTLAKEKTVILSTHIIEDISYTCSKLAILNKGHLLYDGRVDGLLKSARNKVWQFEASTQKEVDSIKEKYTVISINVTENGTSVKFYSDKEPDIYSSPVFPSLEDAYVVLGKEQKGL